MLMVEEEPSWLSSGISAIRRLKTPSAKACFEYVAITKYHLLCD